MLRTATIGANMGARIRFWLATLGVMALIPLGVRCYDGSSKIAWAGGGPVQVNILVVDNDTGEPIPATRTLSRKRHSIKNPDDNPPSSRRRR